MKTIKDLSIEGKKVLIRVDFNVPCSNGIIEDDNRIVSSLETIRYALDKGAKVILLSHLGRVSKEEDKKGKSLKIVSQRLSELLKKNVLFVEKTRGKELEDAISNMKQADICLIENTRFEDIEGKKESGNDEGLGKYWAGLCDVFINDAFGTSHRAHASNVGIAKNKNTNEKGIGLLIEKELKFLGEAIENPKRPLVAILGGSKVSDKINVINKLLTKADKIIIGGGMTYTFLKALGKDIGKSIFEEDKVELAKKLLNEANGKIILPVDNVCTTEFSNELPVNIRSNDEINNNELALDIGPNSIELFKKELTGAKTIIWNGPMGVFEMSKFAKGTIGVCEILANMDATTIIGGGDSAAAAIQNGFASKFSHISTGGGASLEYLEGKVLPGINIIGE